LARGTREMINGERGAQMVECVWYLKSQKTKYHKG